MKRPRLCETGHFDALDRPLAVGDYIAYAACHDRSANMHFGQIVKLKWRENYEYGPTPGTSVRKDIPTVLVKAVKTLWSTYGTISTIKPVTLAYMDRLVRVPKENIPAWILEGIEKSGQKYDY